MVLYEKLGTVKQQVRSPQMIFCDHYIPSEDSRCVVCGKILSDWTGFDGPCIELTFHQGRAEPDLPPWANEQANDGGPILDPSAIDERLPHLFEISSCSCGCPFKNRLRGYSRDGVWVRTEPLTGTEEDRRWIGPERKEEYHRRMHWLNKETEQAGPSGRSTAAKP
jgi:hypothetical protein